MATIKNKQTKNRRYQMLAMFWRTLQTFGNAKWYSNYRKQLWTYLKKLNRELLYNPATPLLGLYPKELKSGPQRDIFTPMYIVAFFIIAKI